MRDFESHSGVYEESGLLEYNDAFISKLLPSFGETCCLHSQGLCSTKRKKTAYVLITEPASSRKTSLNI